MEAGSYLKTVKKEKKRGDGCPWFIALKTLAQKGTEAGQYFPKDIKKIRKSSSRRLFNDYMEQRGKSSFYERLPGTADITGQG